MGQIKAWSYSAYNLWKQCPYKYKLQKIDKLPQKESVHLKRGLKYHKLAEDYLNGEIKDLPEELENLADEFTEIVEVYENFPEEQWAFTEDLKECGWFDKNCWMRIKIDNRIMEKKTALVIDFKTGKMRDGYEEQLELYAFATFLRFPKVSKVITELWYFDYGAVVGGKYDPDAVFTRKKDFEKLKKSWLDKVKPMFKETEFLPKPSYLCNWCDYQGDPCKVKHK